MFRNFRIIVIIIVCLASSLTGFANGLCVENVNLVRNGQKATVSFNLRWDNSWNSKITNNYDGAWVFAKIRIDDGDWKPVYFDRTGHVIEERTLGASQTGV